MTARRFPARSTGWFVIKVIIFDFDGVIVESLDIKMRAFAELFREEGEEVVRRVVEYHLHNGGVSRYEKFRYIYSAILARPLPDHEFERLCSLFAELVLDGVVASPYVPGALEFIKKHKGSFRFFLASATPYDELVSILERRGIADCFERVYGAPVSKIEAVKQILLETGVRPVETIFIGDALSDYDAALNTGVRFIARIHSNEKIFEGISCIKLPDLQELFPVMEHCTSSVVTNADQEVE